MRLAAAHPAPARCQHGVTRTEVVVVLLILAVLGVLLGGWISLVAGRGKETQCSFNIRRLVNAFQTYAALHTNLPAAASTGRVLPDDWIHWQPDRRITESALAPLLGEISYRNLCCPADTQTRYRTYPFSYTMNTHLHRANPAQLPPPAGWILVFEEEHPNDGACLPGHPNDRLARRHAHFSAHAGYGDGSVRLIHEPQATAPINHP